MQASQCATEMGRRAVGFAQTVKGRGELVVGLGSILPVIYGPMRLAQRRVSVASAVISFGVSGSLSNGFTIVL